MKKFLRSVWVVTYRELIRVFQDRARVISSFIMPVMFLVIFGAGFNQMIQIPQLQGGTAINYIQFMYPGIIGQTVLTTSLMSGLSIIWEREFGFLRELMVAPLSRSGIIMGKAIGTSLLAVAQGMIMLILAPLVGVSLNLQTILLLAPLLLVLSIALSGFGYLLVRACVHSRDSRW